MKNTLYHGDNLDVLREHIPDESVDLIYLDPPFFTGKNQTLFDTEGAQLSFRDVWVNHEEYLEWVRLRLQEVRRVLKPTGSVFLHCDWHASHLLRRYHARDSNLTSGTVNGDRSSGK